MFTATKTKVRNERLGSMMTTILITPEICNMYPKKTPIELHAPVTSSSSWDNKAALDASLQDAADEVRALK